MALDKVRVVAMAGSLRRGYNNETGAVAEFNVAQDIPAASAVFRAEWATPLTIAPLDTCGLVQLSAVRHGGVPHCSGQPHHVRQKVLPFPNHRTLLMQVLLHQ